VKGRLMGIFNVDVGPVSSLASTSASVNRARLHAAFVGVDLVAVLHA